MSRRPDELDDRSISRFLALGREAPRRTVDLLLDELHEAGPARFAELLAAAPGSQGRRLAFQADSSRLSVSDLRTLKNACKVEVGRRVGESHLACLAGYYSALAFARAEHGVSITSRPSTEVRGVLGELANATSAPWSDLFRRACEAPTNRV